MSLWPASAGFAASGQDDFAGCAAGIILDIPFQNALNLLQRLQFVAELRDLAIDAGQSPDIAFALRLAAG
jgi:hypothetical protein